MSDFITLFVVIDPIGAFPLFIGLTAEDTPAQRLRIAAMATGIAYLILLFFIAFGQNLLEALHIHIPSFQLAGSIILFVFALTLVFGIKLTGSASTTSNSESARAIFPLAIPGIAGPGSMLTVVLLTDNERFSIPEQVTTGITLGVVLLVTFTLLALAGPIMRVIRQGGAMIISRIMGLILASVAIENALIAIRALIRAS